MIYAENIMICIAVPLILSLIFISGDARRFVSAFLFGMGTCLVAAYVGGYINYVTGMGQNDTSIFISPVVEELVKLCSLLFFVVLLEPKPKAMAMIAVAVGAGFATFENCCYILTTGAENLAYVLIRGLAVGVMHIVSVFAMSIWLIFARKLKVFSFPAIVGGVALAMSFHALYNLLVSEPGLSMSIGYIMPLFTAGLLFLLYRKMMPTMDR